MTITEIHNFFLQSWQQKRNQHPHNQISDKIVNAHKSIEYTEVQHPLKFESHSTM